MLITSGSYRVKLWKYGKMEKKNFTVPILFEVSPSPPQLYNTIRGIMDQGGKFLEKL